MAYGVLAKAERHQLSITANLNIDLAVLGKEFMNGGSQVTI
jgi:hypothetical protein